MSELFSALGIVVLLFAGFVLGYCVHDGWRDKEQVYYLEHVDADHVRLKKVKW